MCSGFLWFRWLFWFPSLYPAVAVRLTHWDECLPQSVSHLPAFVVPSQRWMRREAG